ncbi:hypothetical protein HK405_005781 [Cladochytrium tenue]|nr:hypothetical protein HK405_005781 [Cladochytrium tenue]
MPATAATLEPPAPQTSSQAPVAPEDSSSFRRRPGARPASGRSSNSDAENSGTRSNDTESSNGSAAEDRTGGGEGRAHAVAPVLSRKWLTHQLHKERFHHFVIGLVLFDLILVFLDLILAVSTSCTPESSTGEDSGNSTASNTELACSPNIHESPALATGEAALFWMSVALLIFFVLEVALNVYAVGLKHLRSVVMAIDAIVVYASLFMELYFHFTGQENSGSGGIVILRIWKIVRAMHAIAHAIELRGHNIIKAVRASNVAISGASKSSVTTFTTAKREFLSDLRAAAGALSAARQRERRQDTVMSAPVTAKMTAVGAPDADEVDASLRMLESAERLVGALHAALLELQTVVARENMRQLQATVDNAGADPDDEEDDEGDGGAVEDEDEKGEKGGLDGVDDVNRKTGKRHSTAEARQDADDEETEMGREAAADDWVLAGEVREARHELQRLRERLPSEPM